MSITITLTFRFPMGHRILGLEGDGAKCANIHGHNWQVDIELPNDDSRLEFGAVKALIGGWIDDTLDHGFMVGFDDPFKDYLMAHGLKFTAIPGLPTTEALATRIAEVSGRMVGVEPVRVHVLEGWRNAATWTPA